MTDQSLTFTMGWAECLPMLLLVRENAETADKSRWAHSELERMANVADKAAAALKKLDGVEPPKKGRLALTPEERATVMAALVHYKRTGQGEAELRMPIIHDLATAHGNLSSLDNAGIERLIATVNGMEL